MVRRLRQLLMLTYSLVLPSSPKPPTARALRAISQQLLQWQGRYMDQIKAKTTCYQ
jgi:hypothetical protein